MKTLTEGFIIASAFDSSVFYQKFSCNESDTGPGPSRKFCTELSTLPVKRRPLAYGHPDMCMAG